MNPPHEHAHHHHGETAGRILWLATGLTLAYARVEARVGWWAGSLALALEAGGDMLQPMAIAAIGGLLMENFVSLFLMPCLYLMASREHGELSTS